VSLWQAAFAAALQILRGLRANRERHLETRAATSEQRRALLAGLLAQADWQRGRRAASVQCLHVRVHAPAAKASSRASRVQIQSGLTFHKFPERDSEPAE